MSKFRTYIVRVPITIIACVEVKAKDTKHAVDMANSAVGELTPLYHGIGSETDRPSMVEIDGGWFEGAEDISQLFLSKEAKVTRE